MPTQTFYRLPEEKRTRLTEAAWKEFMSTRFEDVSINRIVHDAQIPRGSFYQYFEDKTDVFLYLLSSMREGGLAIVEDAIERASGEPFEATRLVFDSLFQGTGRVMPVFVRGIEVLRLNLNMDMAQMLTTYAGSDPWAIKLQQRTDWSGLARTDPEYINDVVELLIPTFMCAVRETLSDPTQYTTQRERLRNRLEIIRKGSRKDEVTV